MRSKFCHFEFPGKQYARFVFFAKYLLINLLTLSSTKAIFCFSVVAFMGKKVLVTGANGMLGTHTIRELLAAGYTVRGLLRRPDSYAGVWSSGLELVAGEFTDDDTLRRAMRDCDCVIHCAAKTGQSGTYDSYERINVTATERLVEIAVACGVRRVVNISSANVFAYGSKERPGDETKPIAFPFNRSAYARSKFEALRRSDRDSVGLSYLYDRRLGFAAQLGAYHSDGVRSSDPFPSARRQEFRCDRRGGSRRCRGARAGRATFLRARIARMRNFSVCSPPVRGAVRS